MGTRLTALSMLYVLPFQGAYFLVTYIPEAALRAELIMACKHKHPPPDLSESPPSQEEIFNILTGTLICPYICFVV